MDPLPTTSGAPAPHATPEPTGPGPVHGPPARRAFLVGGLLGAAAGVAGAKAPGWVRPPARPPEQAPEPVKPPEPPKGRFPRSSYAQFGEDLVVDSLFYSIKIEKPTYLDIGAHDPVDSNNTYFFYKNGARGVLVEPTPAYAEKLKAVRPNDTVLNIGIGVTDATEMDFYVMSESQQNTFEKAHAEKFVREKGYKIERVLKIPLVNINRVMAEHFGGAAPDYLSIDVEGWEFKIAKTIDFARFRPKVICIETLVAARLAHNPAITEFMAANGYVVRGMTYPNTIYMDQRLLKD